MKINMGKIDKAIRIGLALLLSALYITGILSGVIGFIALTLGAIFILTSVIGVCPLYIPFGIKTCHKKQ